MGLSIFMISVGIFTHWCYCPWLTVESEERCEGVMRKIDAVLNFCPVLNGVLFLLTFFTLLTIGYYYTI